MTISHIGADSARANSSSETNRRTALGMLALIPAIAPYEAVLAASSDRAAIAWARACRRYDEAKEAASAFNAIYYDILARWQAGRPSLDMIDWKAGQFTYMDRGQVAHVMDVEKHWRDFLDGEGKSWAAKNSAVVKAEKRRAIDSILAYRREFQEHEERSGMNAAEKRNERLNDCLMAATEALVRTPAPNGNALAFKIEVMRREREDCEFPEEYLDALLSDARRIGGEAGHA